MYCIGLYTCRFYRFRWVACGLLTHPSVVLQQDLKHASIDSFLFECQMQSSRFSYCHAHTEIKNTLQNNQSIHSTGHGISVLHVHVHVYTVHHYYEATGSLFTHQPR